jgi:hypothetical protein
MGANRISMDHSELQHANGCIQRAAMKMGSTDEWADQASMIADFEGRFEKLVEALRPFAEFADRFGKTAREDGWQLTRNPSGSGNLTMGNVRRARGALP